MSSLPAPPTDLPADYKACCADLWGHPLVPVLIGDAYRPGGVDLTASLVDGLSLPRGARVLDVGCGPGTTVAHCEAAGLRAVGVDMGRAHQPPVLGDAERLPFADGSFAGVTMECVLSAFPDKAAAVAEARRVLAPGGAMGLTDVTLAGSFPEPLDTMIAWVACAAGALTADGYVALLEAHGLRVTATEDRSADLAAMVAKARRRFALLQGAMGVGITPELVEGLGFDLGLGPDVDLPELAQTLFGQLGDAVERGDLGYTAVWAELA